MIYICVFKRRAPRSAPAFSWTAHTAQGQTLKAAIVDMQIGAGTSPMSSYVAFTRVKKAEDLLIFRPFDRELFNQGDLEGPNLLLQVLRGEHVDWAAIEQKHMPSHMCHGCNTKAFKAEFSEPQWKRKDGKRLCKSCERECSHNGLKKQCKWCGSWHPEDMFEPSTWRKKDPSDLWCEKCKDTRKCRGCGEMKVEWKFNKWEWEHAARPNDPQGRCKDCMKRGRDLKPCSRCKKMLPQAMHFSARMWRLDDDHRKCNACSTARQETEVSTRECNECHVFLTQTFFSDQQWSRVAQGKRTCTGCQTGPKSDKRRGQWQCTKCKDMFIIDLFRLWMTAKNTTIAKHCKCNSCWLKEKALERAVAASNLVHVVKSTKPPAKR